MEWIITLFLLHVFMVVRTKTYLKYHDLALTQRFESWEQHAPDTVLQFFGKTFDLTKWTFDDYFPEEV